MRMRWDREPDELCYMKIGNHETITTSSLVRESTASEVIVSVVSPLIHFCLVLIGAMLARWVRGEAHFGLCGAASHTEAALCRCRCNLGAVGF